MRKRGFLTAVALVGAASLTLSGCLSEPSSSSQASGDNTTVEIMLGFSGAQLSNFQKSVDPWAKSQGITIKWSPSDNFNQLINTRVQGNNVPDVAMFPQPGVLMDLVGKNKIQPLDDVVDMADLKTNMTSGTLKVGTKDSKLYGLLVSMNVKSLVFYPKKSWDSAGYKAPGTLTELEALTAQIKAKGTAPWCLGIESGSATGWPATDWIEDLVLKYGGIDQYNKWVAGDVKFSSDLVKKAATEFSTLTFGTEGNVYGGRGAVASNAFGTAGNPMFDTPSKCYLYKMGNFITGEGFFPSSVLSDVDNQVGVFGFPGTGTTSPVLGGGDLVAMMKTSDAAKKVIAYMSSKDFGAEAAKAGTFLSPRKDFTESNYPSKLTANIAKIAYSATDFAFDGSDSMPGVVGSGSFWKEMTSWISNQETMDTALKNIDASWPS